MDIKYLWNRSITAEKHFSKLVLPYSNHELIPAGLTVAYRGIDVTSTMFTLLGPELTVICDLHSRLTQGQRPLSASIYDRRCVEPGVYAADLQPQTMVAGRLLVGRLLMLDLPGRGTGQAVIGIMDKERIKREDVTVFNDRMRYTATAGKLARRNVGLIANAVAALPIIMDELWTFIPYKQPKGKK